MSIVESIKRAERVLKAEFDIGIDVLYFVLSLLNFNGLGASDQTGQMNASSNSDLLVYKIGVGRGIFLVDDDDTLYYYSL